MKTTKKRARTIAINSSANKRARTIAINSSAKKRARTIAIKNGTYLDLYSFDYSQLYSSWMINNDGEECFIDGLELIPVPPIIVPELELINANVPF